MLCLTGMLSRLVVLSSNVGSQSFCPSVELFLLTQRPLYSGIVRQYYPS